MNVIALPNPKLCHIVRGRILSRANGCDERTRQKAVSIGLRTLIERRTVGGAITAGTDYVRRVTRWHGDAA
jgi:hypothetical protein